MDVPLHKTLNRPESAAMWSIMLEQSGRLLFALAVLGMGVELLVFSPVSGHGLDKPHQIVPVIPWPPAIPALVYPVGVILILCGTGLLFRRATTVSALVLGGLLVLCSLAFDVPRRADLLSAEWRTNVLEPIAIGCLAWLGLGRSGVPGWLHQTGRHLLALALAVFGLAHFQVLAFVADIVPAWIPWHRFWTVFTGGAFIAAGASIATGWLERWAAWALGLMFALWLVTIHLLPVINLLRTPGAPQDPDKWSDVFIVTALWGGSWALAGILDRNKGTLLQSGTGANLSKNTTEEAPLHQP